MPLARDWHISATGVLDGEATAEVTFTLRVNGDSSAAAAISLAIWEGFGMPITAIARFDFSGTLSIADNTTVSRSLTVNNLGGWGRIADIFVTLGGLTHTFPTDLDFLLLGPGGTNLEFWSDAGGSTPISNGNFTIIDSGASLLPGFGGIASGTYRPSDYGTVENSGNWGLAPSLIINHPATSGTATFASAFGGAWVDNSTWSLYVRDDAAPDVGSLASWGFQINYRIIVKPDDFDGNNKSDILWQNNDGTPAMWSMNGASATAVGGVGPFGPFPFNPGPSWHIKDNGDFNDDGKSDILWQNDNGTPSIWLMNGFAARSPRAPLVCSIRGRAGTSRPPATSTSTARPTSCGRTTTARRRFG